MLSAARFSAARYAGPAVVGVGLTWYGVNHHNVVHAKAAKTPTETVAKGFVKSIKQSIAELIETDAEKRGDGTSFTGTFVRLAWHCAGTYIKETNEGGCDGARMRFDPEASWPANAGLERARTALEPIKQKYPQITYADLYSLAGVVAIEEAGGPAIWWRLGREDAPSGKSSPQKCGLPDADKGSSTATATHLRQVFYRMGFNDQELVALAGAHALGRCHTTASGYWGPWTFSENSMSNEYYRLLLQERWSPKISHNGKPWTGPDQFEDKTGKLMMLPSDIVLIRDPEFLKYVEMYAKDEDLFFRDFAKAFAKLLELGVGFPVVNPWYKFWGPKNK